MLYVIINTYLLMLVFFSKKQYFKLSAIVVGAIITTTYYNGSDWRMYELIYDDQELFDSYKSWGPGLATIFMICNFLGLSYHAAAILLKGIVYGYIARFLLKYSNKKIYALAMFIFTAGYGLFIDNPLRQMLVMPFFIYSILFVVEKKLIKSMLAIFAGALFHASILFVIPVYIIYLKKISAKAVWLFLPLCLILILFSLQFIDVFSSMPVIGYFIRNYLLADFSFVLGGSVIVVVAIYLLVYLSLFLSATVRDMNEYESILSIFSCIFLLMYIGSTFFLDLLRFAYYFSIPYSLFMARLYYLKSDWKFLAVAAILFHSLLSLNIVFNSYKFLPYTNYIWSYLTGDLLPYNDRDNLPLILNPGVVD